MNIWQRTLKAVLVPLALVVLVVGTSLPASAASYSQAPTSITTAVGKVRPNSLNW